MNPAGIILITVGLFSFAGGLFQWDWFMRTRRARALVKAISLGGARAFYMLLGIAVILFGILVTLNVVGA